MYNIKKISFINFTLLSILLYIDVIFRGLFVDNIFVIVFVYLATFNLLKRQFILSLFFTIILFWFYLPRLHWMNDIRLLQAEYYWILAIQIFLFYLLLSSITNNDADCQRSTIPKRIRMFFLLTALIALVIEAIKGRGTFVNQIDSSFINFLLYIPITLIPFILADFSNSSKDLKIRHYISFMVIFILFAVKGSKFIAIQVILVPLMYPYFLKNKLSLPKISFIVFCGTIILFCTIIVGTAIRYNQKITDTILGSVQNTTIILDQVLGRLNFLSIVNSSVEHWGKHGAEVFNPVVLGWIPRVFYPDRVDTNNGMWFGRLIGLIDEKDNVYVASTIINDLLIGASVYWQPIVFLVLFVFLFLLKKIFFILFESDLYFMIIILTNVVLAMELNFSFLLMLLIKKSIIVLIFLGLPTYFRSYRVKKRIVEL